MQCAGLRLHQFLSFFLGSFNLCQQCEDNVTAGVQVAHIYPAAQYWQQCHWTLENCMVVSPNRPTAVCNGCLRVILTTPYIAYGVECLVFRCKAVSICMLGSCDRIRKVNSPTRPRTNFDVWTVMLFTTEFVLQGKCKATMTTSSR